MTKEYKDKLTHFDIDNNISKNKRFSIRMSEYLIKEIKNTALNNNMSMHDLIMLRCCTPKDKELNMKVEYIKRYQKLPSNLVRRRRYEKTIRL